MATPTNVDELILLLNEFHIDYSKWLKPVTTLFDELQHDDCYLAIVDGQLKRFVDVMKVKCYYKNNILMEQKQVFTDGTVRSRNHYHVAEKIQKGESLLDAAVRALDEELQLKMDKNLFVHHKELDTVDSANASPSYVGLTSVYSTYNFNIKLNDDQYNPDGYQEVQTSKTTYFVWTTINEEK